MFFLKKIFRHILDIIFPHSCGMCNKQIKTKESNIIDYFCISCIKNTKSIAPIILNYYKKKIPVYSLFHYEDIKKSLYSKYLKKTLLYRWSGKKIAELIKKKNLNHDTISFVPQHSLRTSIRWFNHAEIIAQSCAKYLAKDHVSILKTNTLKKTQSNLNKNEREKNILNIFKAINKKNIINKNIIIIDDIYTTGSTIKEIIKTIYPYKPLTITIFVLAKQ